MEVGSKGGVKENMRSFVLAREEAQVRNNWEKENGQSSNLGLRENGP